jgi:predicted flap endonuclease-1-like 5' DNA nuclease
MPAELSAYLPLILIALVAVLALAWFITRTRRRAKVIADDSGAPLARDVLAEGAAPAARNQALIDAPRTPAPVPQAAPAEAAPAPAPAPAAGDDLARIKGLGPKIAVLLGELGVTRFAQIAAWDDAEAQRIDAQLGRFAGRITRDQWIKQARLLATGDETAFAAQFGNDG